MLHRYGNIQYVFRLPAKRAIKLINKAIDEDRKQRFFMQWLMYLPFMTKDNYVPFEEYYEQTKVPQIDTRPKDEIMRELLGGGQG